MRQKLFISVFFLLSYLFCSAQEEWALKVNKDSIKVFTKTVSESKIKAVKVECILPSTLTQITAAILDIKTCDQWVYNTKSCVIIKQTSPSELYYYSEVNVPWPVSNRDFIAHIIVKQDPKTKAVTVDGLNEPDMVTVKQNIVRVRHSLAKWVITPASKGFIKVEYVLSVDPGGSIPVWLINMFATKGPFETFKRLKNHLKQPQYVTAHYPFIVD